ncbi:MAG TPA: hypothetical protein VFJ76_06485 [Solirubrobacterales bacterium]|nr:hypothetical protein [Solirubrobacterales bacterium]
MKHLKMIGLAAVAAAALMAFLGAGTASATVICKNNLNTNACSEPYPVGTKGKASLAAGSSALLETTAGEALVTCTGSVIESSLKNAGSATTTVESNVSTMSFTGCTREVKVIKGGYAILHHIAGTDNGTLTTVETEVTVNGIFGTSCTYGAGTGMDVGITVGGNPGSMSLNVVFPRTAGSFLCPADARFTGKYTATEPTNAWVAAG